MCDCSLAARERFSEAFPFTNLTRRRNTPCRLLSSFTLTSADCFRKDFLDCRLSCTTCIIAKNPPQQSSSCKPPGLGMEVLCVYEHGVRAVTTASQSAGATYAFLPMQTATVGGLLLLLHFHPSQPLHVACFEACASWNRCFASLHQFPFHALPFLL